MLEVLIASPGLLATVAVVLGLLVGSFLNVVIHRLPVMMERAWRAQCEEFLSGRASAPAEPYNLVVPRSRCPGCERPISAADNIPLLSWLLLRGRCRGCGMAVSRRYPVVEAGTALITLATVWHFGPGAQAAAACVLAWALVALTAIDLEHQLLPDAITLPLLWLGLLLNVFGLFCPLRDAVLGAAAGYLALWSIYWLFKLATGKEGMGFGDFKLLALLGAWLGWQALPTVILLSSLVGALVGLTLMASRALGRDTPIPFGPYLAGAGWLSLIWGADLSGWYLRWATGL